MRRGSASQIARKSLSADYMLQSKECFLHLKALSNGHKLNKIYFCRSKDPAELYTKN